VFANAIILLVAFKSIQKNNFAVKQRPQKRATPEDAKGTFLLFTNFGAKRGTVVAHQRCKAMQSSSKLIEEDARQVAPFVAALFLSS
jgi:hypothetical protein